MRQGGTGILYEDTVLREPEPALFAATTWADAPVAPGYSGGRGATRFIGHEGRQWVLRHYHRGGIVGRLLNDQFLWLGEAHTRCFREWRLLARLGELGLPAPVPVAAHYRRSPPGYYVADLLTARIPDVEPLSSRLARTTPGAGVWQAVGRCIAEFHRAGVYHADLTAHNLQIDVADRIFLLDFDRGRIRHDRRPWREANLARLHRSLTKISAPGPASPTVTFGERQWRWLLEGYAAGGGSVAPA